MHVGSISMLPDNIRFTFIVEDLSMIDMVFYQNNKRRYMTEILPIRCKTLYNQSTNQSNNKKN